MRYTVLIIYVCVGVEDPKYSSIPVDVVVTVGRMHHYVAGISAWIEDILIPSYIVGCIIDAHGFDGVDGIVDDVYRIALLICKVRYVLVCIAVELQSAESSKDVVLKLGNKALRRKPMSVMDNELVPYEAHLLCGIRGTFQECGQTEGLRA